MKNSIKIEVKLFNELQRYRPGGKNIFQVELQQGSCVKDLLMELEIPPATEHFILANGRRVSEKTLLNNDDTIVFFSPVAGG